MTTGHQVTTAFADLGKKANDVRQHEQLVEDAATEYENAKHRLQEARDAFDEARSYAIEHFPGLEAGYSSVKIIETVAIVDGKVTVIEIVEP